MESTTEQDRANGVDLIWSSTLREYPMQRSPPSACARENVSTLTTSTQTNIGERTQTKSFRGLSRLSCLHCGMNKPEFTILYPNFRKAAVCSRDCLFEWEEAIIMSRDPNFEPFLNHCLKNFSLGRLEPPQ